MKKLPESVIHKKLGELGINFLNIDFDNPPEEITYEMLEGEMNKNSLDFVADRNALWRAWSRVMMNPNPFGMYYEEDFIDKTKRKQFLKYCEQIKSKYIDKNKKKSLKKIEYANTIYRDEPYNVAIPAAGGTFLKRTIHTHRQNKKRKKNKKSGRTRKTYYGGRHDDYVPDNDQNFIIRPVPRENYNYENAGFQPLIQSTQLPTLYAMQIPHQFDILSMKEMFLHLMFTRNINYLIDLQACHVQGGNNWPHPRLPTRGCNPNNMAIEMNTWREIKNIYNDTRNNPDIGSAHIPYIDMTSGDHNVWTQVSILPNVITTSSVVHCLAGFGRTSSVIVFLTIRDHIPTRDYVRANINRPYWGLLDATAFQAYIVNLIPHAHGRDEFWNVSTQVDNRRLIERLNYIICHLAMLWQVTPIVAYDVVSGNPVLNTDTVFLYNSI